MRRIFFLFLPLIVLPLSLTYGDVLFLKDGRVLEGKIIKETKEKVVLSVRQGGWRAELAIPRSQILKIEKRKDPWEVLMEEYRARRKKAIRKDTVAAWEALGKWCESKKLLRRAEQAFREAYRLQLHEAKRARSAEKWFQLGRWCQKYGLIKEAKQSFEKAILADPDHEKARKALGYVRYQGKWIPEWEYEKRKEEEMRLKGYVKYKGKWYHHKALEVLLRIRQLEEGESLKKMKRQLEELSESYRELQKKFYRLKDSHEELLIKHHRLQVKLEEALKEVLWLRRYLRSQTILLDSLNRRLQDLEKHKSR